MELFPAAMLGFEDAEWKARSDAHRAVDAGAAVVVSDGDAARRTARGARRTARRHWWVRT